MKKIYVKLLHALCLALLTFGAKAQVASYIFTASSGTFTTLSGSATSVSAVIADDAFSASIPLGFTFKFNGVDYTSVFANSNGFLSFRSTATATASQQRNNSAANVANVGPAVFALWDDQIGFTSSPASSTARYEVTGSAGSRVFTFEWKNWIWFYTSTNSTPVISYQIKLYEGTNVVEVVYQPEAGPTIGSLSATIGLGNTSTDYLTLSGADANPSASSSTFNTTIAARPASGQVYRFAPPAPCVAPTAQPTGLNLVAGVSVVNGTFTAASPAADKYLVVRTSGAALNTNPIDGTTYTAGGTLGNGTIVSYGNTANFSSTGLTGNTNYTYTIFSANDLCSGGPLYNTSGALTGSITTNAQTTYTWNATSGTADWTTPGSWTPARSVADATDILVFSNGGSSTATGVATATVGRVVVSNNTSITLQSAATATLTIASDGTATDELNIASGSSLILGSSTAALTLTYSGTGSTGTIAGVAEATSLTGSTSTNTFNFTGGTSPVTTVTATGVLTESQAGGTGVPVITGSTATLIVNGVYNHKFQVAAGTIPTATWNTGSKVNITDYTTYTTGTAGPSGFGQTFYDVEWNCPNQVTNINCTGTVPGINGTFTITSTGATAFLAFTATTAYTKTWMNYTQTGGIVDLATGASGASAITINGTFNQSGGTLKATGTSTASVTLNFAGTTAQSATFTGQPVGPLVYRISNANGITLNADVANFVVGNGTLGGVRVSTLAATPITLGGSITSLQYNALNSTLTYDAAGSYNMTAVEFPATNGPANLTIAVGAGNVVTMPASFGSRALAPVGASGVLTMTSGDLDINSNSLTLGTSAAFPGTLTYTAGAIRVTTGTLTRWFGTTGLPTSAGTAIGYYPLASGINNRNVQIYFSATTALSTGGTITVGHNNASGTSPVTVTDGAYTIEQQTNAYWPIAASGVVASGTFSLRITGGGLLSTTTTNLRLMQNGAISGTHAASTGTSPNFQANRTALSLANITQSQYIGAANADLGFISIVSGAWDSPATWNKNTVPTSTDAVAIGANTVTVSGAPASVLSITIAANGSLVVSGNTLTVAGATGSGITNNGTVTISGGTLTLGPTGGGNRTFTSNGTLTVSSGTLNVNGNLLIASASTFNQTGGDINIDGNDGTSGGSVGIANDLLGIGNSTTNYSSGTINVTGGNITIVDPHFTGTATSSGGAAFAFRAASSTGRNFGTGHTLTFGSTTGSNSSTAGFGFFVDCYVNSAQLILGNVVVNGGNAPARRVITNALSGGGGLILGGNLTINADSELLDSTVAAQGVRLAGNLVNNGVFTQKNSGGLQFLAYTGASNTTSAAVTTAQSVSGSGIFRNNTVGSTASFASVTSQNTSTSGVTFTGFSPSVSGTVTVTDGKITADGLSLTGTSAQSVVLTAATSIINTGNFTLNNSGGATLSGSGKLNVTGDVILTSGALTTGGSLVLKSTGTGLSQTARIAPVTGSISGTVTVERYVPGKRAFRFLSHPFTTAQALTALTDNIDITGTSGATNGFTTTVTNSPSAFWFNPATGDASTTGTNPGWTAFTNTNGTGANAWAKGQGIRVLVRGAKGEGLTGTTYTPSAVTLDATGAVNTGAQTLNLLSGFNLVGNPYPSPVDFGSRIAAASNINGGTFWIWDASAATSGAYVAVPVGSYNIAMNGVAVVDATAATSITFSETDKVASPAQNAFRNGSKSGLLELQVLQGGNYWDKLYVKYDNAASADKDRRDGVKMINPTLNFYTLSNDNKQLSLDARPAGDQEEIIKVGLTTSVPTAYTIKVADYGIAANVEVLLHDKLLDTYTELNQDVEYSFNVTADAATQGTERFELVQRKREAIVPATAFTVKLSPNPAKDNVLVTFSNEQKAVTSISITSIDGKLIKTVNAGEVASGKVNIDVKGLAKGTYYVTLNNGTNKTTQALQVQ